MPDIKSSNLPLTNGMNHDDIVEEFNHLSKQFDKLHQPGAALQVKEELRLGSGPFNDELTTPEVEALNVELAKRLPQDRG